MFSLTGYIEGMKDRQRQWAIYLTSLCELMAELEMRDFVKGERVLRAILNRKL